VETSNLALEESSGEHRPDPAELMETSNLALEESSGEHRPDPAELMETSNLAPEESNGEHRPDPAELVETSSLAPEMPDPTAQEHELSEAMPDSASEIQLPHLLGARALDSLHLVKKERCLYDDSVPPVGLVAQLVGAFQRRDASRRTSERFSRRLSVVRAPSDGLVSRRVITFNRTLSLQGTSASHR